MRAFLLGIVVTLLTFTIGGCFCAWRGYLSLRADMQPTWIETKFAMAAMDASTERRAPKQENPMAPTEANLLAGAKLYRDKCAICHGRPDNPVSDLGRSFYPPVPQFMKEPPDMEENENFYVIKHGVRWTGMPGWHFVMTDAEIWQVVTFLSHLQNLPPAVQQELHKHVQSAP